MSVSVSVCQKQMEVCNFCLCLQETNGSCRFLLVLFSVCGIPETWRHGSGDMEMETWRHEDMKTWRHEVGDMETGRHGNMETWKHGEMEIWRHGNKEHWRMEK
jgi:hypothetical protein